MKNQTKGTNSTPWRIPHARGYAPVGYAPILLSFFIKNLINHYFGCQIRILRGRFTPGGFLLKEGF